MMVNYLPIVKRQELNLGGAQIVIRGRLGGGDQELYLMREDIQMIQSNG